jgi:hypothetical protein
MEQVDIFNQYRVTENIASFGQTDEAQIEKIAAEGYYAVIHLAMPDHKKTLANEGSIVTSLETKKVWVHCIVNSRVSAFPFRYLQKNGGWSAQKSAMPIFCLLTLGLYSRQQSLSRQLLGLST